MSYALQAPAGLGFTMPASVLDKLDRINTMVATIDQDVQRDLKSPSGILGQGTLGLWNDFTNAPQPMADNFELAPPQGWRWFYHDYTGIAQRTFNGDAIVKRAGEFEWRLLELYDKLTEAGLKLSAPRPQPGLVQQTPDRTTQDDLIFWLKVVTVVGGIAAAGYFLRSVPDLGFGKTHKRRAA